MRSLIFLLCLALPFAAAATETTFTWEKPVPAFTDVVPPDWVINEYRIYCNGQLSYTVQGYDTEQFVTDLAPGEYTCFMRSWSEAAGAESANSSTVTHFVHDGTGPNAPSGFDFTFGDG